MMFGWIATIVYIAFLALSIKYYFESRRLKIYRYLSSLVLFNVAEGILLAIAAILSAYNITIYYQAWYIQLITYFVIMADIIVFSYSNISEGLKKASALTTASFPLFILSEQEACAISPGKIMILITIGFIVALMVDLIYITAKVYSTMKGGKLYSFWLRILYLAVGYFAFGIIYAILGFLVMMNIITPPLGLLGISFGYAIKTILGISVITYYFREIEPILRAVSS